MSCCSDGQVTPVTPQKTAQNAPSLSMTLAAADFVRELLVKEGKSSHGLRIDVMPGGCAGYKYFMDFAEKPEDGDKVFDFHGVKVFMPLMSLGLIKGSTIEYVSSLEATGLRVNNPNMTRACGCGKSFS